IVFRQGRVRVFGHIPEDTDMVMTMADDVVLKEMATATPIMYNDKAVFDSLRQHGYPESDIRNWAATGCVEPTLAGRHFGHTGTIMHNIVASMEMALHNGRHPVM
ncbi:MAG: pyruvate formate lyase family protein, partial [Thermodesulfobacteriota bacterium]